MRIARWAIDVLPFHVAIAQRWWDLYHEASSMADLGVSHDYQRARYGDLRVPPQYRDEAKSTISPVERYLHPINDRAELALLILAMINEKQYRQIELSRWADDGGAT